MQTPLSMHKIIEPLSGSVTGLITMAWLSNFALAMLSAFMGAVVGYIAKKLCDHVYTKYFKKSLGNGSK